VDLIPKYLDQDAARIVTGIPDDVARILEYRINVIFYTGSRKVEKIVSAVAAQHLTPTILELGGQNLTIVAASADVDLAAKGIASSKYLNAGQICMTCNHVSSIPAFMTSLWSDSGTGLTSSWMAGWATTRESSTRTIISAQ
jgi:aldehyde dehydrogenase (NAD+)